MRTQACPRNACTHSHGRPAQSHGMLMAGGTAPPTQRVQREVGRDSIPGDTMWLYPAPSSGEAAMVGDGGRGRECLAQASASQCSLGPGQGVSSLPSCSAELRAGQAHGGETCRPSTGDRMAQCPAPACTLCGGPSPGHRGGRFWLNHPGRGAWVVVPRRGLSPERGSGILRSPVGVFSSAMALGLTVPSEPAHSLSLLCGHTP